MWEVKIHRLVLEEDFKNIDNAGRKIILKSIRKKLSSEPLKFGAPLRGGFSGYRKLRAGDYRIIYRTKDEELLVLVVKGGKRRDAEVYRQLVNRISRTRV